MAWDDVNENKRERVNVTVILGFKILPLRCKEEKSAVKKY